MGDTLTHGKDHGDRVLAVPPVDLIKIQEGSGGYDENRRKEPEIGQFTSLCSTSNA